MKICSRCKIEKPLSEFYFHIKRIHEPQLNGKPFSCCKACHKCRVQQSYKPHPKAPLLTVDGGPVKTDWSNPESVKARGREYQRIWRLKNPEGVKRQTKVAAATRLERQQWVDSLKAASPCSDCGMKFPPECMDFDHLPGSKKKADVCFLCAQRKPKEEILAEIKKCQLVCANCHRIRTKNRRNLRPRGA